MVNAANLANPTLTASVTNRTSQSRATPVPTDCSRASTAGGGRAAAPHRVYGRALIAAARAWSAITRCSTAISRPVSLLMNLAASDSSEEAQAAPLTRCSAVTGAISMPWSRHLTSASEARPAPDQGASHQRPLLFLPFEDMAFQFVKFLEPGLLQQRCDQAGAAP